MKILSTAWNIFTHNGNAYEVKRNGGSIMIADICEYIGRVEDSYLFIGSEKIPQMEYGHIHVLGNATYLPEYRTTENIGAWQVGLQRAFRDCLKELKPDFVLVQGGGDFSSNCMEICKELGQKYALVDHLFEGNRGLCNGSETNEWEDRTFIDDNLNVVAVSTSMRQRMLETYPELNLDRVIAIPNGTSYKRKEHITRDFRKEFGLGNKRVLLCSGTLHPRKNQMQLIDAFKLLPNEIQRDVMILFCGNDSLKHPQRQMLEERINHEGLNEGLRYIGTFPRDEMHDLYAAVDGLVMPSLNEGLSLVALEAIVYGKPVIMFSDNETAGDVNAPYATVMVDDHSDMALAEGIVEWHYKEWSENAIMRYGTYFNMERVRDEYISYIKRTLRTSR